MLPPLWRKFFSELSCEVYSTKPLLTELVNESIMDHLIETSFSAKLETSCGIPPMELTLNKDEENIIRYTCGYVCMHLRKKLAVIVTNFIECLDKMREQHDDESSSIQPTASFLEYTQEWTTKVNRRGLVIQIFCLFGTSYEKQASNCHLYFISSIHKENTTEIVKTICDDEDVLFYWTLEGVDLDEEDNKELLKHIVQLCLTIQGFSVSKEWIKQYKAQVKATRKKKSLCKQLKKKG